MSARRLLGPPLGLVAGALAAGNAYQLVLLGAAAADALRPPRRGARAGRGHPAVAVVIPAHDEEAVIAGSLAAVRAIDYPPELRETIVVADNCGDATARLAAEGGATVWERTDPELRGKGRALAWGLDRVMRERPEVEVAVLVDADCRPSPNLLRAVARATQAGAAAVQAGYFVANPERSAGAGMRYAAFALMNHVRPRGRSALGLSAGLLGTGMAFTRPLLERVPWRAGGLVEDAEQHVELVEAGERVVFVAEARVESPMPAAAAAGEVQQSRWESGRIELARRHAPRLAAAAVRERDPARAAAALDLVLPPQSIAAAAGAATALAAAALGARRTLRAALLALGAQAALVVGGLALVRAPASAYRSLAAAPLLIAAKLRLYARIATGRGATGWERTPRDPA